MILMRNLKMSKQVRVNIRTAINSAGIRRERRDGRDYIIVPSATMPDGIVMNRIRYPADEIAKAFGSLENTPAPLGHPTVEGAFVSASNPEGLARGWIGAWNRNVRRENGRVFVDKVIDVMTASQLEGGKTVLNAIEKGEPIHTSTGLVAMLSSVENDADADWVASDILFDHDAILLGEEGAATPEQGVGMLVNKAIGSEGKEIEVINSVLDDELERDLNWAADSALRAVERQSRAPLIERIKSAIRETILGDTSLGEVTNQEEAGMDKAQFDELSGEVKGLKDAIGGIGTTVAEAVANALKPVTDQLTANAAAQAAKDAAEKEKLVNKVVKAGLLDEETAKAADIAVLNVLAEKAEPGQATLINGAYKPAGDKPGFKLPKAEA
jgi:hypothetical protein